MFSHPCSPAKVVNASERTGFAQHRWEGPILESSHCLSSLPCVSCYMGSECQYKDTPENPYRYPKAQLSQLAQAPQLPSPPPSTSSLLQGSQWQLSLHASWWGRFQSFDCAVHVFVPAVSVVLVCPSSPCALSSCLVCLALAVSPCGVEEAGMWCMCCVLTCPAAVLTHLAFPAAFPWPPRNGCLLCRSQPLQNSLIKILGCFTAKFLCSTPHQNKLFCSNRPRCFHSVYFWLALLYDI